MPAYKEFTCIVCPRGCALSVGVEDGRVTVSGNACPKGEAYGAQEAASPMRSLTTTVRTKGSSRPRLPVRTSAELPLARLFDAMAAIAPIVAVAPVRRGDALARDLLGLGVDVLATDDLPASGAEARP